jgi:hypothetical protein
MNPITKKQQVAEEWVNEAYKTRLTVLRAAAQHWQSTVSTITGLFGAATLLDADEQVRKLAAFWSPAYGGLVLLSLVFAAAAIWLASSAGVANVARVSPDIDDRVKKFDDLFENAQDELWCSRFLTALAAMALVAALGVRWYAPQIEPAVPAMTKAISKQIGN